MDLTVKDISRIMISLLLICQINAEQEHSLYADIFELLRNLEEYRASLGEGEVQTV